jgi:hypothetical protein
MSLRILQNVPVGKAVLRVRKHLLGCLHNSLILISENRFWRSATH